MEKFGKSQSIERREDDRFITGAGRYVDDTAPSIALHGYVFRSVYPHGRIKSLNVDVAKTAPGVRLVLTAQALEEAGIQNKMEATLLKNKDESFKLCRDAFNPYFPKVLRVKGWVKSQARCI